MFESYETPRQNLIDRLQDIFTSGQQLTQLGIGSIPPPPPPPPTPISPTRIVIDPRDRISTAGGSVVPSPAYDRMSHMYAQSQDTQERLMMYNEIKQIFISEILTKAACDILARGAVAKGFALDFSPTIDTPEAEYHTKMAEFVLTVIHKRDLTGSNLADWAVPLLQYGNLPIQIVSDEAGTVNYIQAHAPFGFRINNNSQLKFKPHQQDAYIQFDTTIWQEVIKGKFTEAQMIWPALDKAPWERYGNAPIYPGIHHARSLVRGFGILPDAREASMPEKVYPLHDSNNVPLDDAGIRDFLYHLPKAKRERGEKVTAFDATILNGAQTPTVLTVGTDYFNQLGDLRKHQELVCVSFGICLAILIGQESVNRATMASLLEALYERQAIYAGYIEDQIIRQIFQRALIWAGVNPALVQIKIIWSQRKSPERARLEAIDAMKFRDKGMISNQSASQVVCAYLGLDPKAEQAQIEQEKSTTPPVTPIAVNTPSDPQQQTQEEPNNDTN